MPAREITLGPGYHTLPPIDEAIRTYRDVKYQLCYDRFWRHIWSTSSWKSLDTAARSTPLYLTKSGPE